MSGKTYRLEVSETELARVMFVMARVSGYTDGESVYNQAYDILELGGMDDASMEVFNALHEALEEEGVAAYHLVQEEWEKALGIGEFKKSPVQQRIENLEKELDELKKLL